MISNIQKHISVLVAIVFLDQITKYLVLKSNFPYILNSGIAFSIPLPSYTTIVLTVIVITWLYTFWQSFAETKNQVFPIALGLITGGAIGNMIDRFRLGAVIDFIKVPYWPTFNVADSAVCIGMALLLWELMKRQKAESKKQNLEGVSRILQ